MKEIITMPMTKTKSSARRTNLDKTVEKLEVSRFSEVESNPSPMLSPKRKTRSVDATQSAALTMTMAVCDFLRSRSFIEKKVSLIHANQLSFF